MLTNDDLQTILFWCGRSDGAAAAARKALDLIDAQAAELCRLRAIFVQDFCRDNRAARLAYAQGVEDAARVVEAAGDQVAGMLFGKPVVVPRAVGDLAGAVRKLKEAAGG